jgi:glutaminyl-peptide cyclotransferase
VKNANLLSWRSVLPVALALALAACEKRAVAKSPSIPPLPPVNKDAAAPVARFGYDVVHAWPHDRSAFTQGLMVRNGNFIESTGLNGRSSLREVDITTGRILKRISVPPAYFAEGATAVGGKIFQLTWQNQTGFIYDADTFAALGEFRYDGEGWGLTTDGTSLILSDGTSRIRFLDPATFRVTRTLDVLEAGRPVRQLNELEYVRGEILANVWQTDRVVRIDATTGLVRGAIDFTGLLAPKDRTADTDVLNGIAYDEPTDRLFVTGKNWPEVFEVRLKPAP